MNLFVKVCLGRFHDILPKKYSGTLPLASLGEDDYLLSIWMPTNNGVSQILSLTGLKPEIKAFYAKQNFYYKITVNQAKQFH